MTIAVDLERKATKQTNEANNTLKHLIFPKSKFGNFKRLTYWRSLILRLLKLI